MGALYFSKARQRWISEVSEGSPPNRLVRRKVARTKGEAELNLRSLRAEYARPTSTMTVGEYLASWLRTVERDVKASTWQTYEIAVRRQIEPAIGHVRLGDLAHDHVERMVRALRMSPKGIRNVLSVLSGALTDAERQGLVRGNAAAIVRRPRVTRKEPVALSLPEIRRILETVRGDRLEALYVVALASGLRQAELLGLRWEDWDRDAIAVRFALERSQGRYSLVEPKTRRSRRLVRSIDRLRAGALDAPRRRPVARRVHGDLRAALGRTVPGHGDLVSELMTLDEVAERLRVSRRTIERLVEAGRIRVLRVGRRVRVTEVELDTYVASLRGRHVA